MVAILIGTRRLELSRVPCVGERIAIEDESEQLVTAVVHLSSNPRYRGIAALVETGPVLRR